MGTRTVFDPCAIRIRIYSASHHRGALSSPCIYIRSSAACALRFRRRRRRRFVTLRVRHFSRIKIRLGFYNRERGRRARPLFSRAHLLCEI